LVSVIIVNYNVRDFILHALQSIKKALKNLDHEIIVVDNASVDGSPEFIKSQFPDVILIENEKNVGFAAANNIALKQAKGEYLVLINPDTLVQEDTFTSLMNFMKTHPDAGAATCKILNPDGSFSLDSRHSIPSPSTAIWKILGLSKIFPKNKIFGQYNLTYLDPDDTYPVDAISGSFMFIRREAFLDTGLLDEDFFMYCEDIDYCHRLNNTGWKIYYVPESNIIHYKGESTKKDNIDYVINFNKSLYLYFKKHFQSKYLGVFKWFILAGVSLRGLFIYIKNFIGRNFAALLDLIILNLVLFITFYVRFELKSGFEISEFFNRYIFVNLMASMSFLGTAYAIDLYRKLKYSIVEIFKTNLISFLLVASVTFFLNQLAFSRMVVLISFVICTITMIGWRIALRITNRDSQSTLSKSLFRRRVVIVGTDENTRRLLSKMRDQAKIGFDVIGIISEDEKKIGSEIAGFEIVASLNNLERYVKLESISQVIFSTHSLPYELIIKTISKIKNPRVEFKVVPENMEVIIGKSSVERLSDFNLVEIDYAIGKSFNRFSKRIFDILLSGIIITVTLPAWIIIKFLAKRKFNQVIIADQFGKPVKIVQSNESVGRGFKNFLLLQDAILKGNLSFVGAPIRLAKDKKPNFYYKPGLSGFLQIQSSNIRSEKESEQYELYYLKNQNFWLDLEILTLTLIKRFK